MEENKEVSFWQEIGNDINWIWRKKQKLLLTICLPIAFFIIVQGIHEKWEFYNWSRHFCNLLCIFGILFCLFGLLKTFSDELDRKK